MAILGIDEVGRGPLAGPLVIGAVILPSITKDWFKDLKDSKQLTAKKRETLSKIILQEAITGLGWVPASELDQLGISKALKLATRRAVKEVQSQHAPFSEIIIDGKVNFLQGTSLAPYVTTCIKADAKFHAVSAASIIAKVARDRYMIELAAKYPDYSFDKHVGYGTAAHLKAIYTHGLTPEHRQSFEPCKSLAGFQPTKPTRKNTTDAGRQAESAVATYLKSNGHQIIAKNHKTYFYEIDLISVKADHIYFTEVKYRKSALRGSGLDVIDQNKLRRMHFAAESFLKYTAGDPKLQHLSPILAAASVTGNLTDPTGPQITWFPLET